MQKWHRILRKYLSLTYYLKNKIINIVNNKKTCEQRFFRLLALNKQYENNV